MIKSFILILSLLLAINLNSQSFQSDQRVWDLSSQRALSDLGRMKTSKSTLSNIEGSEYFTIDFTDGTIENLKNEILIETKMRYNAFYDEIELIIDINGNKSIKALLKDKNILSHFSGKKFIYLSFKKSNDKLDNGYLTRIFRGNRIELFEKRRKKFLKGRVAKNSLDVSHAPKYVDDIEFYISMDGKTPNYLKNTKKGIISYFDKSKEIKEFIKSKDLNFNDYQSIITVIKHFESNLVN